MATYTPYTPNYNRMQAAVTATQQQRATVAGPPSPMMTSGVDMSEGVEQRARNMREMAGPQQPQMINGVQRYNAPAAAQAPAAAPAQPMMPAAQPQQAAAPMMTAAPAQAQAPVNPLGGMDTRSLSARGGPMGYSQQGVGTNNPNSFAVGQKRAPLGMRLLERQARRRDPRAIGQLASMEQQSSQNAAQMGIAQMREAGDAQRFSQQQQQQMSMFQQQQAGMQQRDATGFDQQKQIMQMQAEQRANESAQEFQRRQTAEAAERAAGNVVGAEAMQVPGGGFVPMVKRADGSMAMAGGFMPERKPDAPLPPGLVAQGAVRDGIQYGPADKQTKAPSFTYEKDPNGRITGAVYPVQDPKTGSWKLQRADINGDGVVDAAEAAAAAGSPPAASTQTKSGNSYSFK